MIKLVFIYRSEGCYVRVCISSLHDDFDYDLLEVGSSPQAIEATPKCLESVPNGIPVVKLKVSQ